jgi:hypothetical protein
MAHDIDLLTYRASVARIEEIPGSDLAGKGAWQLLRRSARSDNGHVRTRLEGREDVASQEACGAGDEAA